MNLAVRELPDGLALDSPAWDRFVTRLALEAPDLLVLNEMPIGGWIATGRGFDEAAADGSVAGHDALVATLQAMPWSTFGSRPVNGGDGRRLANEAFLVTGGTYVAVHHKHFFPQEEGWYEQDWFEPHRKGFDVAACRDIRIGALLCTELMFNEWARHYRRSGAHVIAVPRAAGALNTKWRAACAMAAVVSGCYVASSNRAPDPAKQSSPFGGGGVVFAPDGELIAETSPSCPIVSVVIELASVERAQTGYPCYVSELRQ